MECHGVGPGKIADLSPLDFYADRIAVMAIFPLWAEYRSNFKVMPLRSPAAANPRKLMLI